MENHDPNPTIGGEHENAKLQLSSIGIGVYERSLFYQ